MEKKNRPQMVAQKIEVSLSQNVGHLIHQFWPTGAQNICLWEPTMFANLHPFSMAQCSKMRRLPPNTNFIDRVHDFHGPSVANNDKWVFLDLLSALQEWLPLAKS